MCTPYRFRETHTHTPAAASCTFLIRVASYLLSPQLVLFTSSLLTRGKVVGGGGRDGGLGRGGGSRRTREGRGGGLTQRPYPVSLF